MSPRSVGAVVWVIGILAIAALAPTASASPEFEIASLPGTPATISGSSSLGNLDLKTEAGSVECANGFSAEAINSPLATLPLAVTYTGCKAFGFLEATVKPEGCTFDLTPTETVSEDKFTADFAVTCPEGKAIRIIAASCELEVKPQSGLKSVALVDDTGATPDDVTFDPGVGGLAYTVTKDGFLCPFSGTGNKTGGTLTATTPITLSAKRGETGIDFRVVP